MKLWKHLLVILLVILFFISNSYALKNSAEDEISNRMLLEKIGMLSEKIELYQSINEKKFELLVKTNNQLRADMNRRFELLREDMNKRFELLIQMNNQLREDINKRFDLLREDMNSRFEFLQNIYIALIALIVGTPFVIESRRNKRRQKIEEEQRQRIEGVYKEIQIIVATFNELAKNDENIRNALNKIDKKGILMNSQMSYVD